MSRAGRKRKFAPREANGKPQRPPRPHFADGPCIYFVGTGDGLVKVGRSKDWITRVTDLQIASAAELSMFGLIGAGTQERSVEMERRLHRFLKDKGRHVRGEWFRLSVAEVDAIEQRLFREIVGHLAEVAVV